MAQVVNIHIREDKTLDLLLTNSPSPVNRVKGMPPIGKADLDIVVLNMISKLSVYNKPHEKFTFTNKQTLMVREQSSLTFFYKIHPGTVAIDIDKYLTPAPNLQRTRASHDSQYTTYFAYSDALKNSCSPGLLHCGIVFLLRWTLLRPLKSLRLSFILLVQRYVF